MRYFKVSEFFRGGISWYEYMSFDLLDRLDEFRLHWGNPVSISPHDDSVGRQLGSQSKSYHNIDRHGEVKAVDVMPFEMNDSVSAIEAIRLARHVGFYGIGLYPDWRIGEHSRPGLHLDIRPFDQYRDWGAYRNAEGIQVYTSCYEAILKMGSSSV